MKTPTLTRVQGKAVLSGGNFQPFEAPAFLPAMTLGLTERYSLSVRYASLLTFERGLTAPPLFGVEINDFGRPFAHQCRAGVFLLPRIRPALFNVLHQFLHNCFKAFHGFGSLSLSGTLPPLTNQSSEGEMECGSKNQGMRCQI